MDETTAITPSAHRFVRWLDAQETAFAGGLIVDGDHMRVRIAAERVPDVLWDFAEAEHVAGIRDLVRTRTGHDVLLPWCTEPIDVFLGRRVAAAQPLTTGETVTLVASLLRGVTEVGDASVHGRWWLTDDARPLFAPGEGGACGAATATVISRVRDGCTDRMLDRVLTEIATDIEDPRALRRSCERWEHELTELAAPRALVREVFPAERVSEIAVHRDRVRSDAGVVNEQQGVLEMWRERGLAAYEWAHERLSRSRARVDREKPRGGAPGRVAPARAGRGRMLLVGAAVAGLVLGAGLLWPADGDDSAATEKSGSPSTTSEAAKVARSDEPAKQTASQKPQKSQSESPDAVPTADAITDGSLEQRVAALLEVIAACAQSQDQSCAPAIADGAGEIVQQRLAPVDPERSVSPIEDYGDIAVVRLGATDEQGEQMLVLIKTKDGWLVRDVYDVADQPSGEN